MTTVNINDPIPQVETFTPVDGGIGNDRLFGGIGRDLMSGGDGADRL